MNSNAQDPNEEIFEESSTPVTSPPTDPVEPSSSTASLQTDNPQSGSVKMAAANFNIPPPAKFDPKTDDWDHWIKRYELFEAATERDGLSDKVRINTLIYVMGNNAADIYDSFKLSGEDIQYAIVKQKFKDHFKGKVALVFERTQFVRRFQQDKESVLTFIEDLQRRADLCSFGDLRDQMVHTQIIAGLRDSHLRRRLMANDNLTLDQVIKEVKSAEITKHQDQILQNPSSAADISEIHDRKVPENKCRGPKSKHYGVSSKAKKKSCYRCGAQPGHPPQRCPAKDATCNACNKKSHFSKIGNSEVHFKIDTGADVTVIPEEVFRKCNLGKLRYTSKRLFGADHKGLCVIGTIRDTLSLGEKCVTEDIYVVKGLKEPILGQPAIQKLNLLARINEIQSQSYEESIKAKYPQLFHGLGELEGEYEIKLKSDAQPFAIMTPRRVPLPIKSKVKEELARMEKLGVIRKVDKPTNWCAGMVTVPKPNGKIRICVDLTKLNENVCRETYPLPKIEALLGEIGESTVFTKIDANSGFWQEKLAENSQLLTTFLTPFGRYCFQRLPFGLKSAPERFQKRMLYELEGLEGVICIMDDILLHGNTQKQHDERLEAVLTRLIRARITLNPEKCEFSRKQLKFAGLSLSAQGIGPDPDKTAAIEKMEKPQNVAELRRFLGMMNHQQKFIENLSEKSMPLRDLLSSKNKWHWNASSYGLGAVLLQVQEDDSKKPIAYASRSMTSTEQRYAQIEKEALATTWACEKFADFVLGKEFLIETDHKPLVPLLGSKCLQDMPPRIQRFRMRLMRYSYQIVHVPGKDLTTADTLSRAPLHRSLTKDEKKLNEDLNLYVSHIVECLPTTERRLQEIRLHQDEDEVCSKLKLFCSEGWPEKHHLNCSLQPYWQYRAEITVQQGILMKDDRVIIPSVLRLDVLDKIHTGHQGIQKCRERAKSGVWWPNLSKQIEDLVRECPTCIKTKTNRAEPMIPTQLPERPFQKVGTDLFEWKGQEFVLGVDYFSRYCEIGVLRKATFQEVINHLKAIFARHGIPETVISDNGPQYSAEFTKFAEKWGYTHITSSPKYPQSNGEAESMVQTTKTLLTKSDDPYEALLAYRATPLENGFSPAELCMGRRLRTTLPTTPSKLTPQWPELTTLREKEAKIKTEQMKEYNRRHAVKELSNLSPGDRVYIPDRKENAVVVSKTPQPRSYYLDTDSNATVRRNRRKLNPNPKEAKYTTESPPPYPPETSKDQPPIPAEKNEAFMSAQKSSIPVPVPGTTTRSGRKVNPPKRLGFD
ncbi:Transposon Ty3-I Gag-Pol polyprotein [Stylophora pistillata]|uniref:RNA-directed DNA polymerase n=1 Tax=Stylophora pistillata TaxID=50429 RepID=A0A2B4RZI3_STYPI|nr:Transposon Ty3-I Gag-Pol polyprotein [Stylophora pistillata]